jgi:inosine-uridine nucleoside N-ribohydrolase
MSISEIRKYVRVHLGDGDTRGQTIVDHLDVLGRGQNCRVVLRADRKRFIAMIRDALVN